MGAAGPSHQISACDLDTTFDLNASLFDPVAFAAATPMPLRSVNRPMRSGASFSSTSRMMGSKRRERRESMCGTRRMRCRGFAALGLGVPVAVTAGAEVGMEAGMEEGMGMEEERRAAVGGGAEGLGGECAKLKRWDAVALPLPPPFPVPVPAEAAKAIACGTVANGRGVVRAPAGCALLLLLLFVLVEAGALALACEGCGGDAGAIAPFDLRRRNICVNPCPTLGAGISLFEWAGRRDGDEGGEGGANANGLSGSVRVGRVASAVRGKAVGAVLMPLGLAVGLLLMGPATAMVRRRAARAAPVTRGGGVGESGCLLLLGLVSAMRSSGAGVIDCEFLRERRSARKPAGLRLVRYDDDGGGDWARGDDAPGGGGEETSPAGAGAGAISNKVPVRRWRAAGKERMENGSENRETRLLPSALDLHRGNPPATAPGSHACSLDSLPTPSLTLRVRSSTLLYRYPRPRTPPIHASRSATTMPLPRY